MRGAQRFQSVRRDEQVIGLVGREGMGGWETYKDFETLAPYYKLYVLLAENGFECVYCRTQE